MTFTNPHHEKAPARSPQRDRGMFHHDNLETRNYENIRPTD